MSGNVGVVAFEAELNSLVHEYLGFCEYAKTTAAFEDECLSRGKHLKNSARRASQKTMSVQGEMMQLYRKGNRKAFFDCWEKNVPRDVRNNDPNAQKLEFNLYMYFAVFPLKYGLDTAQSEESMAVFKKYLETKGAVLSQTTEFLPFYALPYVQNPKSHPTYRDLFNDLWTQDLQARLEKFLVSTLDVVQQPRLFEIYKNATGQGGQENTSKAGQEQKLYEAERRAAQYIKRHNKVQADYHNLIGITAELVDGLESTLQGKPIAPDFLQDILSRLFSRQNVNQSDWDFSRPGTAGAALRQSVLPHEKSRSDIDVESYPPNLDYAKMKTDMVNADGRTKARVMQALRLRLTKCPNVELRRAIIKAMIDNDILGCTRGGAYRKELIDMLRTKNDVLQQCMARFLNALASFYEGRKYLTQNVELIDTLISTLKHGDQGDAAFAITAEHLLATLQKLSLRRAVQVQVIDDGLVEWLVDQLEDHDALSDYTLEYSIALLMNLCLRTAGKQACVPIASKAIKVLSSLLGHQNSDLVPYVNGAIYSILSVPSIREEALRLDFEETLHLFMKDGSPDNNRQLEYIIKQLHSSELKDVSESDEDEPDDEFDDEEQDGIEPEVDKGDCLKLQSNELGGERLLLSVYFNTSTAANSRTAVSRPRTSGGQRSGNSTANILTLEDAPLNRPITPGGVRNQVAANAKNAARLQGTTTGVTPSSSKVFNTTDNPSRNPNSSLKKSSSMTSTSNSKQSSNVSQRALDTKGFESRPKIPRTPDASTYKPAFSATSEIQFSNGTTSPKNGGSGLGEYKRNSPPSPGTQPPPRPLYSDSEPRPTSANRPSSSGQNGRR